MLKIKFILVLLCFSVFGFLSGSSVLAGDKIVAPEEGCYTGVFSGWGGHEDNVKIKTLQDFQSLSGKAVAFVPFSNFWGERTVPKKQLNRIAEYGAVPMLRMMPWKKYWEEEGYEPKYSMKRIINGRFDKFLKRWAKRIKKFKKPVMITFGEEMNGDWFPWSGKFQGGKKKGPKRYKKAFRHIVKLFRKKKVKNATWVWQPNHDSYPEKKWNRVNAYYPGDKYVDWVGFSLYGAQNSGQSWVGFEKIMDPIYNKLTSKYPDKPLMMAEWGVREPKNASKKADWYSTALSTLPTKYNKVKISILYNEKWAKDSDLRINSSVEALAAWKNGISNDYFLGEYVR